MTGTKVFSPKTGDNYKDWSIDSYGRAKMTVVTNRKTVIVDGAGNEEQITARLTDIKNQLDIAESEYDKEKIKDRLSKLTGGVAIIYVGAETELELKERKYRLDDAISATRSAIAMGIVPGGGSMLAFIKHSIVRNINSSDINIGYNLLIDSLDEPFRVIIQNQRGVDQSSVIWNDIIGSHNTEKFRMGYNMLTSKVEDMHETGIIDPALVSKTAIEKAASVAGLFLTTGGIICNDPADKDTTPFNMSEYAQY